MSDRGRPLTEAELDAARERVESWLYTQNSDEAVARRRLWAGLGLGLVLLVAAAWVIRLPPRSERVPPPPPNPSVVEVPVVGPLVLSPEALAQGRAQVDVVCSSAGQLCDGARAWQVRFEAKDCANARQAAFDLLGLAADQPTSTRAALSQLESLSQRLCARTVLVPAPTR